MGAKVWNMECNLVARGGDGGDILKFSLRKWPKKRVTEETF